VVGIARRRRNITPVEDSGRATRPTRPVDGRFPPQAVFGPAFDAGYPCGNATARGPFTGLLAAAFTSGKMLRIDGGNQDVPKIAGKRLSDEAR
jgi:hypothetical protein